MIIWSLHLLILYLLVCLCTLADEDAYSFDHYCRGCPYNYMWEDKKCKHVVLFQCDALCNNIIFILNVVIYQNYIEKQLIKETKLSKSRNESLFHASSSYFFGKIRFKRQGIIKYEANGSNQTCGGDKN